MIGRHMGQFMTKHSRQLIGRLHHLYESRIDTDYPSRKGKGIEGVIAEDFHVPLFRAVLHVFDRLGNGTCNASNVGSQFRVFGNRRLRFDLVKGFCSHRGNLMLG